MVQGGYDGAREIITFRVAHECSVSRSEEIIYHPIGIVPH